MPRSTRFAPVAGWLVLLSALGHFSRAASDEPPGPASRRTPLAISEIHYHPKNRPDRLNLEFVEVYNSHPWTEDLSGYSLAGGIQFVCPTGTLLEAGGFLVVAADPAAIRAVYAITNVVGPFEGRLDNASEQIRLLNRSGAELLEITYSSSVPWPIAANGAGHSLVLARPSLGQGNPMAWRASHQIGGSPGQWDLPGNDPAVVFNEVLSGSAGASSNFVELCNLGPGPADLSGCSLTDDPTTNKFTFPSGTQLAEGGLLAVSEIELNFTPTTATLFLIDSGTTRVLDALRLDGRTPGISWGKYPDGRDRWSSLENPSAGLPNTPPHAPEILINEIMYGPISRRGGDEFIELFNPGTNTVDLSHWRFVDGVEFSFPPETLLAAQSYLVVASDVEQLRANHPGVAAEKIIGNFSGRLSGAGERIVLARPQTTLAGIHYSVVDEVGYGTGGRWPAWADNGGSSLERVEMRGDGRSADLWADSDETRKADWTTVEVTGRLDHGDGSAANALQILLMGPGECLIDDVEVIGPTGLNLLTNPSFETGLSPWVAQGDHDTSFRQSDGGIDNSACLRLRASGDGDPGANRIRVQLSAAISVNATATLRAKIRWLRGHPEILLRLSGNYLEAFGSMSVPAHLGTPGAPNTSASPNAAPAIEAVGHHPILPASNEPVVVTARLSDPDGISHAWLKYRIDPDTNTFFTVPLVDDGSGADTVPGDGIHTALIPGQLAGRLIAFHIEATDAHHTPTARLFPSDAPTRECLVRFGETYVPSPFGTYRLWVTLATFNRWSSRLRLSNAALDGTFVYGDHRAIYNVGVLYAGSAYHAARYTSPTGVACDYKILFPPDDPFLGGDEATVVWPGLTGGDPVDGTAQQEQTSYWVGAMLGLPFNYQRYVHFFLNGTRRSFIMQDTQKPDRDSVRQWFPDNPDGDLFKVQIWREYDASANNTSAIGATLGNFTTLGGAKKTARYRWSWTPRAAGATVNTFSDLFDLVDAVNSDSNRYTAAVESTLDIDQWMRTFATEHLVGNWDSYGYGNGQNLYAYKPRGDRWKLMIWDLDVSLGNASDPPTADLFKLTNPYFAFLNGDPAVVDRMYKHPKFVRAYWRAIQEAVHGPLDASNLHPMLDARYAAFTANAISAASPAGIKNFLASRRNYCLTRLAAVTAPFALNTDPILHATNNPVLLAGTAPVEVADLQVDGRSVPVTWINPTSWVALITLTPGQHLLAIQGFDRLGAPLESAFLTQTVNYTGPAPPSLSVVINEWVASNTDPGGFPNPVGGEYDDWFELFNLGSAPANLNGHYLTDNLAAPFRYAIPDGYSIPAGGRLLAWADGQPSRNNPGHPDLHVNFKLAREGETLALVGPDGTVLNSVTYGSQTNNVSQGRWPDGAVGVFFMVPTPRAANLLNGATTPLVILRIALLPEGHLSIAWQTFAGKTYYLEQQAQLNDSWSAVGEARMADGSEMTHLLPPEEEGQRFYRVRQAD